MPLAIIIVIGLETGRHSLAKKADNDYVGPWVIKFAENDYKQQAQLQEKGESEECPLFHGRK